MSAARSSGFWTGGRAAFSKALAAEFKSTIAELKQQLKTAETLIEQTEMKEKIAQTKRDYAKKSAGHGYIL